MALRAQNSRKYKINSRNSQIIRDELNGKIQLLRAKVTEHENNLHSISFSKRAFIDSVSQLRVDIKKRNQTIVKEANRRADELLSHLNILEKDGISTFDSNSKETESKINDIRSMLDQADQNMLNTNGPQVVQFIVDMETQLPDITNRSIKPNPTSPRLSCATDVSREVNNLFGNLDLKIPEDSTNSFGVSKEKSFTIDSSKEICSVCPINESTAWIAIESTKHILLVHKSGNVQKTVNLPFVPFDIAVQTNGSTLLTSSGSSIVHCLSRESSQTNKFSEFPGYSTWGITSMSNDEVLVCLGHIKAQGRKGKIAKLSRDGAILQNIESDEKGVPLYKCPTYITYLTSGLVAVVDWEINNNKVVVTDLDGRLVFTWRGGACDRSHMGLRSITRNAANKVLITDDHNNQVHMVSEGDDVDSDGNLLQSSADQLRPPRFSVNLLDKISDIQKPCAVAMDTCGDIWLGCGDGSVHILRCTTLQEPSQDTHF